MKQNGLDNIDVTILRDELAGTGCTVEVTRCCVWITGNTYPLRGALKNAGWKYSGKRRAWWKPTDTGAAYTIGSDAAGIEKLVEPSGNYKLCGRTNDGTQVVIATCSQHDISEGSPWNDLDYALGY